MCYVYLNVFLFCYFHVLLCLCFLTFLFCYVYVLLWIFPVGGKGIKNSYTPTFSKKSRNYNHLQNRVPSLGLFMFGMFMFCYVYVFHVSFHYDLVCHVYVLLCLCLLCICFAMLCFVMFMVCCVLLCYVYVLLCLCFVMCMFCLCTEL